MTSEGQRSKVNPKYDGNWAEILFWTVADS